MFLGLGVGPSERGRCAVVTVDRELLADALPTYLTRFVGRNREITTVPLGLPAEKVFAIPPMGAAALRSTPLQSDGIALFLHLGIGSGSGRTAPLIGVSAWTQLGLGFAEIGDEP
jgi:hypothetical protein